MMPVSHQEEVVGVVSDFIDGLGGGFGAGRLKITRQLAVEPGISFNRIELPQGRFTTELVTTRTT